MKNSISLRLLQRLILDVDFREVLINREKSKEFNKQLWGNHTDHLQESHQFNILRKKLREKKKRKFVSFPYNFLRALVSYEIKMYRCFKWSLSTPTKVSTNHKEYAVIRGIGYQHLNEFIPIEEIIDSLPKWIFCSESKDKVQFFIEGKQVSSKEKKGSSEISLFSILTKILNSRSRNFLHSLKLFTTSQLIVGLAMADSKIRSLIQEIPELLIFLNADITEEQLLIIDTQGSFEQLPLFHYILTEHKNFRNVMVHYSEGGMPYTDTQPFRDKLIPEYEKIPVDIHVVWSQEFADFYNSRGERGNFRAAGPQIFRQTNEINLSTPWQSQAVFVVFDETPSYLDEAYEHFQEFAGLSFLDTLEMAISDLKDYCSEQPLILLKQKRRNLVTHSKSYLKKLETLEKSGILTLVPWHANPYTLISQSVGVLTSLGSSPALIARHLGVPVVYGYFGEKVISRPIVDYGFEVLRNKSELSTWMRSLL
jgi:polysaccharide biosynthesis PFTS motif protein